jgi:hypothetical protein
MCGACEDEVFLTTPNPHCILRGLAPAKPAGAQSRRSFVAAEVVDDAAEADQRGRMAPALALPLLSLSAGRARAAMAART